MSNLVSINCKKVLGAYIDSRNGERVPEDAYFYGGLLWSVVLPQFVLFVYGGLLPLIAFAVIGLAGLTFGLARYYWFPYQSVSCVYKGSEARIPPRANTLRKKRA